MTSDLSIGTIDSESLGVLVARGDDCPPEMQRASWRSLLPFLRLREREREREREGESHTHKDSQCSSEGLPAAGRHSATWAASPSGHWSTCSTAPPACCIHTHTQRNRHKYTLSLSLSCAQTTGSPVHCSVCLFIKLLSATEDGERV